MERLTKGLSAIQQNGLMTAGDRVRLVRLPPWVAGLPEESRRVFEFCAGRDFPVMEVDEEHGALVLDVSAEVDQRFGGVMNDIRVEREFVERRR